MRPRMVTYKGEQVSLPELARKHGIGPQAVYDRLRRGWDIDRALKTPVKQQTVKRFEWQGQMYSAKELAKLHGGITETTMYHRLETMSVEEAMTRPLRKTSLKHYDAPVIKAEDPMRNKTDTKPCENCQYHGTLGNSVGSGVHCDYIGVTQHMRPCPPPPKCTVRVVGPSLVRKMALKMKGMKA